MRHETAKKGETMRPHRSWSWVATGFLTIGVLALSSCNTDVTNPGPVQGEFLADKDAQGAMVSGIERALADALNWIAYTGGSVAREIHPSGSTGSFGITAATQNGELRFNEVGTHWSNSQRARGMAEQFIAQIEETGVEDQVLLDQAYLWAGYTYRLMGENLCQSVKDGGPAGDRSVFLDDAIRWFDKAAASGDSDIRTAAIAGRAGAKVHKRDWAGAVADAAQVSTSFSYVMNYHNIGDDVQANRIHIASLAEPYKAHTVWSTWVESVGFNADSNPDGDPRLPWADSGEDGDAAIDCCGTVPFLPQQKYDAWESPIELSSGQEMRLIEAEDQLMSGNLGSAMALINGLRDDAGVAPAEATTIEEGWTALKRERAIEMWLEGRRLPDLWRWWEDGTPGDLDPLEEVSGSSQTGSHLETRCYCFPVSEGEEQTNVNISGDPESVCSAT